jgi:hypothetical protein
MQLNKRDIITIAILTVLFLSVATWNVGIAPAPVSTWQGTENQTFYIDLGSTQNIEKIYFFVNAGNATVNISSGSPGNWVFKASSNIHGDYSWATVNVNGESQYWQIEIQPTYYDGRPNFYWSVPNTDDISPGNYIKISEIGIQNTTNQKVDIISLTNTGSTDTTLTNLADEQAYVEVPPTYMSGTYFDEVYFVRAAQNYLNHQTSFERTHPPLGKLIQAAGIAMFGSTPFGWRMMGVIFGALMIPLIYVLGKKLMGTWIGGFAAAFLLTFDFLHFTMARMGTVDTYVAFFSILSQLCFVFYFFNVVKHGWKTSIWPLFGAFVFFALGFSTKWVTMWSALGMLALLVALRLRDLRKVKGWSARYQAFFNYPFFHVLSFVGVVVLIYFATYIPDLLTGTSFPNLIKLQFEMYSFHSTLTATHQFMSSWWSWPILVSPQGYVPLWLSISYLPNSIDSTISAMGNPAIWWIGFAAMLVVAERAIRGQELASALKRKLKRKTKTAETTIPTEQAPTANEMETIDLTNADFTIAAAAVTETEPTVKNVAINEQSAPATEQPSEQSTPTPEAPVKQGRPWDIAAIYIATIFFFSWLPYVFISRATFIYHFYISVPLLCLGAAYLISSYWHTKKGKIATIVFFAAVIGMFIAFYPVISGMPTSTSWIHALKWFFAP